MPARIDWSAAVTTNALGLIASEEGYDSPEEMLEAVAFDASVPGMCLECEHIQNCEPDAQDNYCDGCGEQSVVSCLVIGGLI